MANNLQKLTITVQYCYICIIVNINNYNMNIRREEFKSERNYSQLINGVFDGEVKCDGGVVVPNVFTINITQNYKRKGEILGHALYKELYIERKYSTIGEELWNSLARYGKVLLYDIVGFIACSIRFNTNIVRIQQDAVRSRTGRTISGRDFISAISILEDRGVIRRTDMRSIYSVNPLYIYKGDIDKLAKIVCDNNFVNPLIVDNKLCLDKIALFEEYKDDVPVIIKNEKYYSKINRKKNLESKVIVDFNKDRKKDEINEIDYVDK